MGGNDRMGELMLYAPKKAEALDLDTKNQFQLLKIYFNSRATRVMETKHWYHLYRSGGFSREEAASLGDCRGRIRYWELQDFTFTFSAKLGSYTESEFNVTSEPFWSGPK